MSHYKSSQPQPLLMGANDSSDDSGDEGMTVNEATDLWYESKSQTTCNSYRIRVGNFTKWYSQEYGRPIDGRLKCKHLKRYFVKMARTNSQLRAVVVCIKSWCRFLYKKKILRKDITISIEDPKQLPPKSERVMTPATVKAFFALANQKKNPSTHAMLSILTYGGLRLSALSRLHCSDIKRDEHQGAGGIVTKSYKIHVRNGKGGKSRYCPLHVSVGASLYAYAQSLKTTFLFPSPSKKGKPVHSQTISSRIKRMARHPSIGKPEISAHFFRRKSMQVVTMSQFLILTRSLPDFMASNALHNGGNLADISRMLGVSFSVCYPESRSGHLGV